MEFEISNNKLVDLAKVFSPKILKELSSSGASKKLVSILDELGLISQLDMRKNVYTFFNDIYKVLLKNYRNEYVYKNIIIKKILLGKHSLNTAHLINECRVGNSKADCVILNGTSTVYEIKSEFDNFSRLNMQLEDYKKAFEYIYIVIPSSSLEKLEIHLDDNFIGIMILNKNNTITKRREAKSNKLRYDKKIIFDLLRKEEYLFIVEKHFGKVLDIPNTRIYNYCKELFCKLDREIIHSDVMSTLKKRKISDLQKNLVINAPDSLKALSLQTKLTKKEKENLLELLKKEIKYII